MMRSVSSTSFKFLFVLSALLLLSACNSELTGIDAPLSVEAGQAFEVTVTQQFVENGGGDSPTDDPIDSAEAQLVLGVVIPSHMSADPLASYQGTWDGIPVEYGLTLQSGIPETNLIEFLENSGETGNEDLIEYLSISDCATVIDALDDEIGDYQLLFFQSNIIEQDGAPNAQPGDGGEFSFWLTTDGTESEGSVVAIHGWLFGGSASPGDDLPPVDVLGCGWYPDPEQSGTEGVLIPDAETADFRIFPADSEAVPVLSGAMIAILALLLAMAGIMVGRRNPGHRD